MQNITKIKSLIVQKNTVHSFTMFTAMIVLIKVINRHTTQCTTTDKL